MSLQFIRHSVYTRGLKELQESQYPGCWKSSAAATAAYILHKPTMRVPCSVKHTAVGVSGLKLGFQFGSHYIYNMRCNRKDCESRAKDRERACPSCLIRSEKNKPRNLLLETTDVI